MATGKTSSATFDFERAALRAGQAPVAGVDEAGRGPWAGPVVAAAVVLDPHRIPKGLNDSKVLTARQRDRLFDEIAATSDFGVGVCGVDQIDEINILRATMRAMRTAVANLKVAPLLVLVDGNLLPEIPMSGRAVVDGDALSQSIAAASIVAKVTRDRMMVELGRELPLYGFGRHKGYGTAEHRAAIAAHGVTAHHRRSFKPIRLALELQNSTSGEAN
jgi:ribonuclease HII